MAAPGPPAAPGSSVAVAFLASMPPVGFSVFDVQAAAPVAVSDGVRVDRDGLESRRYRVRLDQMGNVASVFDKRVGRELLAAPLALELRSNPSPAWPAWEILWETLAGPARAAVAGPAEVRAVEAGPVRGILEVRRRAEGSVFVERVGLTLDGELVEIATDLDWRTPATLLKAVFPLTAVNARARFDLGLGTIERENATQALYEVPAQQWAAIDDRGGAFGVAIASDSKYGWDKPDDHTLRLSLVHTPEAPRGFAYQGTNDLGRHRFTYAIGGYRGDWRAGACRSWRLASTSRCARSAPSRTRGRSGDPCRWSRSRRRRWPCRRSSWPSRAARWSSGSRSSTGPRPRTFACAWRGESSRHARSTRPRNPWARWPCSRTEPCGSTSAHTHRARSR